MIRPHHSYLFSDAIKVGIRDFIEPLANQFDLTVHSWEMEFIWNLNQTVLTLIFKRKSFDDRREHRMHLPLDDKNAFEPVELPKDFAEQLKNIYFGSKEIGHRESKDAQVAPDSFLLSSNDKNHTPT